MTNSASVGRLRIESMDRFSLDELLRHAYSGAIFLATIAVVYPDSNKAVPLSLDAAAFVTIGLGFVLLAGTLVYVIHRAFLYPCIYSLGLWFVWGRRRPSMMEIDLNRFARRNDDHSVQRFLGEWGSQVHFLYCTTWSVLLGVAAGTTTGWGARPGGKRCALAFGALVLIAAIAHHLRLLKYDRAVAQREPVGNAGNVGQPPRG